MDEWILRFEKLLFKSCTWNIRFYVPRLSSVWTETTCSVWQTPWSIGQRNPYFLGWCIQQIHFPRLKYKQEKTSHRRKALDSTRWFKAAFQVKGRNHIYLYVWYFFLSSHHLFLYVNWMWNNLSVEKCHDHTMPFAFYCVTFWREGTTYNSLNTGFCVFWSLSFLWFFKDLHFAKGFANLQHRLSRSECLLELKYSFRFWQVLKEKVKSKLAKVGNGNFCHFQEVRLKDGQRTLPMYRMC